MRKLTVAALLLTWLAGCATGNTPTSGLYGNFIRNPPAAHDQKMADDAVKLLIAIYPPARTRFDLQQATPDVFGTRLVESLRTRGYALLEFKPAPRGTAASTPGANTLATPLASNLPLRYILDLDADSNLYRITLLVGNQSLTRAYMAQNGALHPAGAWVRMEQ